MSRKLSLFSRLSFASFVALVFGTGATHAQIPPPADAFYEVTISNISTGQPLSPPIIATHSPNVQVFAIGGSASDGLRLLAEEGDNSRLRSELFGAPGVHDLIAADLPLRRIGGDGPPGSTTQGSFMVRAAPGDVLSIASMLGCTNDGFTGVSSLVLPMTGEVTLTPNVYDAGTEMNTERSQDLPDPCGALLRPKPLPADGGARRNTTGVVSMHPGLTLIGDLDASFAWNGPVMRLTISRVR